VHDQIVENEITRVVKKSVLKVDGAKDECNYSVAKCQTQRSNKRDQRLVYEAKVVEFPGYVPT
jgi:hypothetical protein